MTGGAAWTDAIVAVSIVLSATTYLFDFGSNIAVLVQYSTRYLHFLHREQGGISSCDAECRQQTSDLARYFYVLLAILAFCHSLNAILFKLKFTHKEAPLCAAYFLPLMHLYRLSHLVWRTLSCKGIHDLRSAEMNGLYCILGSSLEGVPMLILQFCGYFVLTRSKHGLASSMSITFKVSVAASLVSAAYNGGTSVQSIAKNATSLKQKLGATAIAASFTLTAALARCLTLTYITVYMRPYFMRQRRVQVKFTVFDSVPVAVVGGSVVVYLLYFWLLHSPRAILKNLQSHRRLLTAFAFSCMSLNLGPLYPLISQANDANQLGSYAFRLKLFTLCLLHLLLDLAVLCVTRVLGTLPSLYIIVSSVVTVGYLLSLIAYIKFDALCGPQRVSGLATLPFTHVTEHKRIPLRELFMLADIVDAQHAQSEYKNWKPHDAASQVQDSEAQSDNTGLPRSGKAEIILMGYSLVGGVGPSRKHTHCIKSHPEVPEAKSFRPFLTSSLSLNSISTAGEKTHLLKCSTWRL